jgi:orotate phosphoribosyltransferase
MNEIVAKILLEIKAVHLRPHDPFTWTSGVKSPIYCDNRQIISYPHERNEIINFFVEHIKTHYPQVELIAGTATAGIPWASWLADRLNLPMIYIRSQPKGHGLENAIEGKADAHQKVLVIEDLISTGKSSIQAAKALHHAQMDVLGVVAIFNYGFDFAQIAFKQANFKYSSLCDLATMLDYAYKTNLLTAEEIAIVTTWKNSIKTL